MEKETQNRLIKGDHMEDEPKNIVGMILVLMFSFLGMAALMFCVLTSCTISLQNISTHGTATDLVDENQKASPTIQSEITAQGPKLL